MAKATAAAAATPRESTPARIGIRARTRAVAALFAQARTLAAGMNRAGGRPWVLKESSTGGASDGNFTAALGVPTLDGLGAVGEGAHAAHESVVLSEIPRRAALLAALIASI